MLIGHEGHVPNAATVQPSINVSPIGLMGTGRNMSDLTSDNAGQQKRSEESLSPLSVPQWLTRAAGWSWRLGLVAAFVILTMMVLLRVRIVVVPLLISLMVASVLRPIVGRIEKRGIPRPVAAWLMLIATFSVVAGMLSAAGHGLTVELTSDTTRWADVYADVTQWVQGEPLSLSPEEVESLESRARDAFIGGMASAGANRARLLIEVVSGLLLSVAMTFFLINDNGALWSWIVERVAPARRNAVDQAGSAAMGTLRSYLMAVSLAGVVDAFAIGLGLWIIGVPLVIPLAVITFFAAFLPVVGATAAGVLAATVALVANGPIEALVVVALTLVVQQLEGNLVLPVLMGNHVPLHPVVVLVALTAGGSLAGIIGAFVAVPFAAMVTAAAGAFRAEIPDRHLTV